MKRTIQTAIRLSRRAAAAGLLVFAGCSTGSLFRPYPYQVQPLIRNVETGRPVSVDKAFGHRVLGRDRILYLMEQGRLAQIQGDFAASRAAYADALAAITEMDGRAVVNLRSVAGQTSALVLNDNAIPYAGDGYERVMLHHGQALNYLFAGDLEGAGVEVRLAAAAQDEALKQRAREVEMARDQAMRRRVPVAGNLDPVYRRLDPAAGRVKNSFQNAYTFYMSAVVREMLGDAGGAYIDYKKAAEIASGNPYVRADVLRLAEALGMTEEAADFRARWPETKPVPVPAGQGELIVFFEDGFLPPKQELSVLIPLTGSGGWTPIALPVYAGPWRPAQPLAVQVQGGAQGETAGVCELDALAARALRERMPAILTRQVLRAFAKGAATRLAYDREGDLAVLFMTLYNMMSEHADLRGWSTLPHDAEIVRLPCPAGRRTVTLTHRGTGATTACDVEIRPGGLTILLAVRAGGRLTARSIAFGPSGKS